MTRISRRACLRGLGVALALPFFESLGFGDEPKKRRGKPPVRCAFLSIPNGVHMAAWKGSTKAGLSPTLEPLKSVIGDVLIIDGLGHDKANGNGDGAGDHARETGTWLTGAQCKKTSGADIAAGVSIDQTIAQRVGHLSPLPSLELGLEEGGQAGNCDSGYSCAYTSNISWRTPSTPMAKEISPKAVFQRLFVDLKQPANNQQAGADVAMRKSILDLVQNQAKALSGDLGGNDRRKLDEYLEAVRALEQRIQSAAERGDAPAADVPDLKLPDGVPGELTEHAHLMLDLIALAFQTDTTRIATLMFGNGGSGRTYPFLGVSGAHHELTHHGGDETKIDAVKKIDKYHVELFAYFIDKLKATKDGDVPLIESCIVVYGSGTSDGARHNHNDLPLLVGGRGGGTIRTGRPLQGKGNMSDLFVGVAQRMGAQIDSFGDSTKQQIDW